MSTQKLLGLPPIPLELKPILPFLQRAEELSKHEPIISYWCAYYAAQVGISLKARDNPSRDVLFNLLGVLESMKKEMGNIDAIEIEAASAAFVENFALKVFQSADNEDRRGVASRTTAKKFLAASNFLEVLRIFPKAELSESVEDKIRYAKWKAADISKAFREGRKPMSGPAVTEQYQLLQEDHTSSDYHQTTSTTNETVSTHQSGSHVSSPQTVSQGTFSESPRGSTQTHRRDGSGSSIQSGSKHSPPKSKSAWVSDDVERNISPSTSPTRSTVAKLTGRNRSPEGSEQVHFESSADIAPYNSEYSSKPRVPSPTESYQGPASIYASPSEKQPPSPPSIPTNIIPPPTASYSSRMNIYASPSHSEKSYSSSPPRSYSIIPPPPPPVPAPIAPSQVELTPQLITRVQKHCRFAISSLDYEDAEQAKKELRTALALLGGI